MYNITYSGKLKTTLTNGEEISFNNKGTRELGRIITKALAGYNISDEIPQYFNIEMFEKYQDGREVTQKLLNRNLPLTGITYSSDDLLNGVIGELNLSCIIMSQNKQLESISDNTNIRFCIYNSKDTVLAEVSNKSLQETQDKVDSQNNSLSQVYNKITEGTDCLISWKMSFLNSVKDESNGGE